jgi:pyruvate formate lyase activating enzyme
MHASLPETAAFIRKKGLALKLDTQGSFPSVLRETMPFCDYIAMDWKMPLGRYDELAGVPVDMAAIRESLELLKSGNVPFEMRTTVIPGIHTLDDMRIICEELRGVGKLVLQPFIPRDNLLDETLRRTERAPRPLLEEYASICRECLDDVTVR